MPIDQHNYTALHYTCPGEMVRSLLLKIRTLTNCFLSSIRRYKTGQVSSWRRFSRRRLFLLLTLFIFNSTQTLLTICCCVGRRQRSRCAQACTIKRRSRWPKSAPRTIASLLKHWKRISKTRAATRRNTVQFWCFRSVSPHSTCRCTVSFASKRFWSKKTLCIVGERILVVFFCLFLRRKDKAKEKAMINLEFALSKETNASAKMGDRKMVKDRADAIVDY